MRSIFLFVLLYVHFAVAEEMANVNYYTDAKKTDKIVVFDLLNVELKKTHHHVLGYYATKFTTSVMKPDVIVIGDRKYLVSDRKIINLSYDGVDLLVQPQNYILGDLKSVVGIDIYDEQGNPKGALTNSRDDKFGISGELYNDMLHFSNVVEVKVMNKTSRIVYAGKAFDRKEDLVDYIDNGTEVDQLRRAIVYRTMSDSNTQLIVYEGKRNLVNVHFRCPLINNYYIQKHENMDFN